MQIGGHLDDDAKSDGAIVQNNSWGFDDTNS